MSKIMVVGSLNMDLVVTSPKVPIMGETILGSGFMTCPGGKGANQAVAAARLGGNVAMLGCVGDDSFGRDLMQNLKQNHVDTENIKAVANTPTGIAMIVINKGDNFIIVDPGANSKLSPERLELLEDLICESAIVVIQLEIPMETVEKAVEIAKRQGVKVLLNPAPARSLSDDLLKRIDIFTPNESECEIITGIPVKSVADAKEAIKFLQKKGIPQVIITMGGKGVVYNRGEELIHKSVPEVVVVDTTAAGDSFTGAVAVAVTRGMDIDSAVDYANVVGTLTVTKKGAQASLPTSEDVEAFMG